MSLEARAREYFSERNETSLQALKMKEIPSGSDFRSTIFLPSPRA